MNMGCVWSACRFLALFSMEWRLQRSCWHKLKPPGFSGTPQNHGSLISNKPGMNPLVKSVGNSQHERWEAALVEGESEQSSPPTGGVASDQTRPSRWFLACRDLFHYRSISMCRHPSLPPVHESSLWSWWLQTWRGAFRATSFLGVYLRRLVSCQVWREAGGVKRTTAAVLTVRAFVPNGPQAERHRRWEVSGCFRSQPAAEKILGRHSSSYHTKDPGEGQRCSFSHCWVPWKIRGILRDPRNAHRPKELHTHTDENLKKKKTKSEMWAAGI